MSCERLLDLALAYDTGEQIKTSGADIVLIAYWLKETRDIIEQQRELVRLSNELVLGLAETVRNHAKKTAG